MKILNEELDFDFYDADNIDKVAEEGKKLGKELEKIGEKKNRNIAIRETCNNIMNFFEQILGTEAKEKIFKHKVNWNLCFNALDDFFEAQEEADKEQTKLLKERNKKYERYLK